jgi:AraC family transcriptional regulator
MSGQIAKRNRTRSSRAYGAHLANCFGLPKPPSHVTRTLRHGVLAVTELQLNSPTPEPTAPIGYDDAFLVTVHMKDIPDHEFWLNDRVIDVEPIKAGTTYIHDLRQNPRALVHQPAHALHFYMPLAVLNAFAEHYNVPAISDLAYKPGRGHNDPLVRQLSQVVLTAFQAPRAASGLFLDQLLNAVCAHTLEQYGTVRPVVRRASGGLARWQERRAKEMMSVLDFDVSIAELAAECGLSATHFIRAFRESTGTSPHQWLLARRIERATSLLVDSNLTLAEVALTCGFCNQGHLSRVFVANVGISPGRWRRAHKHRPDTLP